MKLPIWAFLYKFKFKDLLHDKVFRASASQIDVAILLHPIWNRRAAGLPLVDCSFDAPREASDSLNEFKRLHLVASQHARTNLQSY